MEHMRPNAYSSLRPINPMFSNPMCMYPCADPAWPLVRRAQRLSFALAAVFTDVSADGVCGRCLRFHARGQAATDGARCMRRWGQQPWLLLKPMVHLMLLCSTDSTSCTAYAALPCAARRPYSQAGSAGVALHPGALACGAGHPAGHAGAHGRARACEGDRGPGDTQREG